ATQIAQARADAEKVRIEAEAAAQAEAIRITTVAAATAGSIHKVNEAIQQGGEAYFRYKQIEMLPEIAPFIADALAKARLITISGGGGEGGAADATAGNITSVIQTVLAAQLVAKGNLLGDGDSGDDATRRIAVPAFTGPPRTGGGRSGALVGGAGIEPFPGPRERGAGGR